MSNKEIKVSTFELVASNGNLKALSSNWSAMPSVSAASISESKGRSAECIKDISDVTLQVKKSFAELINNTVGFLSSVGVSFEDADSTAAQNIDTLSS